MPCHQTNQLAGKPLKTVLNLTTTIDSLSFNHDGQMLVMASRMKRDALRCASAPACSSGSRLAATAAVERLL